MKILIMATLLISLISCDEEQGFFVLESNLTTQFDFSVCHVTNVDGQVVQETIILLDGIEFDEFLSSNPSDYPGECIINNEDGEGSEGEGEQVVEGGEGSEGEGEQVVEGGEGSEGEGEQVVEGGEGSEGEGEQVVEGGEGSEGEGEQVADGPNDSSNIDNTNACENRKQNRFQRQYRMRLMCHFENNQERGRTLLLLDSEVEQHLAKNPMDHLDACGRMDLNKDKIFMCHVPKGNPCNYHTLRISKQGAKAQLRQHAGDYLGKCEDE